MAILNSYVKGYYLVNKSHPPNFLKKNHLLNGPHYVVSSTIWLLLRLAEREGWTPWPQYATIISYESYYEHFTT